MPTYLDQYRNVQNNDSGSSQELNCRQVYEHVQGCPLCKIALRQIENGHQFTTSPAMVSDIPQSVIFLVVALIIIMVMYIVKNLSN